MESRRVRDEPASSTCTEISKLGLDMPASDRWRARRRCEEGGDDGGTGERERGHQQEGCTGKRETLNPKIPKKNTHWSRFVTRTGTNESPPTPSQNWPRGPSLVPVRVPTGTSIGPDWPVPVGQPGLMAQPNRDHRPFFYQCSDLAK